MRQGHSGLGDLVRSLRQRHGWTLKQMSQLVDIPASTLAKVEHGMRSLNYERLQQLASRLGMTLAGLLGEADEPEASSMARVTARKSEAREANSVRIETAHYGYRYLCTDLSKRRMVPILVRVRAQDLDVFRTLSRHSGEEFVYVLDGAVEVRTDFYSPVVLETGQGIYLDSSMNHAYLAHDCTEALVLAVCSSSDRDLAKQLMALVEGGHILNRQ